MKKMTIFTILSIICMTYGANAADWWNQSTVCKIDTTKCYATMGAGFDAEMWDVTGKCRGMKYICPNALIKQYDEPTLVSREDINAKTIKSDYDTTKLGESGDCFGTRKINSAGDVLVNGQYVKVYCHGVLDDADETLPNGEIVYGEQPTCASLKSDGYIAVKRGKCYGKYLDESKYHIQCGDELLAERIIKLNGAEFTTAGNTPTSENDANKLFDKMYSTSKSQKEQYFKE